MNFGTDHQKGSLRDDNDDSSGNINWTSFLVYSKLNILRAKYILIMLEQIWYQRFVDYKKKKNISLILVPQATLKQLIPSQWLENLLNRKVQVKSVEIVEISKSWLRRARLCDEFWTAFWKNSS